MKSLQYLSDGYVLLDSKVKLTFDISGEPEIKAFFDTKTISLQDALLLVDEFLILTAEKSKLHRTRQR